MRRWSAGADSGKFRTDRLAWVFVRADSERLSKGMIPCIWNVRPGKFSGFSLLQNRWVSGWSRAVPVRAAMVRNRALFM